jgi:hypothetical protein
MDQAVNIPFSIRLDAGESRFRIDVDKKYTDNPNRLFGFSSMTLTPDYFSRQAFKLDLDSEEELKSVTTQDYYIEVDLDKDALDKHPYSSTSKVAISSLLRKINKHYEQHKPEGFITPLVVFDWHHIGAISPKVDKEAFYTERLTDLYVGTFDANSIGADVSSTFQNVTQLNIYPFPTKIDDLSDIIIRITLAPNVTVAFSNETLPSALGFTEKQYTQKNKIQSKLQNPSATSYKSFYCENSPSLQNIVYTTKIHTYPTDKHVVSEKGLVSTSKERERKPSLLATDYNNSINALAKQMNLDFSLVHDEEEKIFTFVYPNSADVKINLRVTPYMAHRLGFGHVTYIRPSMTSQPYPEEVDINNVEAIAKVLVYDTGMVVVSLDQQASKQTYQFTNTVMAIMESDEAGVMTTKPGIEYSRVPVSYFNPNLEFVLSKFNEANEPIPLGWKVAAYIRGVLVGKV